MNTYTHTLTLTEVACGVTLEDVARELVRGMFCTHTTHHDSFMVAKNLSPALAGSVARCAFGGKPVEFSHLFNGCPVYRAATA